MTILICAATPKELAALAPDILPSVENITEMRPMRARLKHDDAIFMATGVGPVNAALAMGFIFGLLYDEKSSKPAIDGVLCAGLAGAFDLETTPLRSLWRVSCEIWPEYGLNDGNSVTARAFSFPLWSEPTAGDIYDRIFLTEPENIKIFEGASIWGACESLTVAGVSASFARRENLWNLYHAPLENMEGFAVAYAAARAEVPCMEIRSVSNKVGPRTREEKDFDGALQSLGRILPTLTLKAFSR